MFISLLLASFLSIGLGPSNDVSIGAIKNEIVEYRERYSSSFSTERGTIVSLYSGSPINYLKNGQYYPIDTSFKSEGDCYLSSENDHTVTLNKNTIIVDNSLIFTNLLSKEIQVKDNMVSCYDCNLYSLSDSLSFTKTLLSREGAYCYFNLNVELLNSYVLEKNDGLVTFTNHKSNCSFDLSSPLLLDDSNTYSFIPSSISIYKYANEKYRISYKYDVSKVSSQLFSLRGCLSYPTGSYHDYPYINNKYFQVGYSSTYTTNLTIGESSLLDPLGNTPIYKTVYSLTLPTVPSNCHSIGSCSFFFKRYSGTQSLAGVYHISNYIDYSSINGTSSLTTSFISNASLSSSYSQIDIQSKVLKVYSDNNYSNVLNLLITGKQSNKTAILNGTSSSEGPYFTIEYSTSFGTSRAYNYTNDGSLNCYSYALFRPSVYYAENYLSSYYGNENLSNNDSLIKSGLISLLNLHCNSVTIIKSHDELIPTTHRRIAIRLRYDTINYPHPFQDYHVMWQCGDGSWAAIQGPSNVFTHNTNANAPTYESEWGNGYYNTNTFYFAIVSAA